MGFSERLVNARKQLNKTQLEMAEEIGISATAYKKYETGNGQPTMQNLLKIADMLEISIDELCGRWETTKDQELMIRLSKVSKLDDEEKNVLNTILESLLIRHYSKNILSKSLTG